MTLIRTLGLSAVLACAAALSACEKETPAPTDVGVCYKVEVGADGKLTFNKVADNQPRLENCEIELEKVRLRFIGLGGNTREIIGAYQGNYIWVAPEGVFFATSIKGHRYPSLPRDDNGRLVIPGARGGQSTAPTQ